LAIGDNRKTNRFFSQGLTTGQANINKKEVFMTDKNLKLTRRKFMIAGSAAVAVTMVGDIAVKVPEAMASVSGAQKIYYIGHDCMGCQVCRIMCPAGAINYGDDRNEIDQKKCIHCGTCYNECPISVISES
jgi:ferredoxin